MFKKIIGLIKKIYWFLKFKKIGIDLNDFRNLINAQKELENNPKADLNFYVAIKKEFSK